MLPLKNMFLVLRCLKAAENNNNLTRLKNGVFFTESNTGFVNYYAIQYINLRERDK